MSKSDSNKAMIIIRNYVMERFLERLAVSPYRDNLIQIVGQQGNCSILKNKLEHIEDLARRNHIVRGKIDLQGRVHRFQAGIKLYPDAGIISIIHDGRHAGNGEGHPIIKRDGDDLADGCGVEYGGDAAAAG